MGWLAGALMIAIPSWPVLIQGPIRVRCSCCTSRDSPATIAAEAGSTGALEDTGWFQKLWGEKKRNGAGADRDERVGGAGLPDGAELTDGAL